MNKDRENAPLIPRAETGAMCFGDDWRGLFIRGDNALAFARKLAFLIPTSYPGARGEVLELLKLLESADHSRTGVPVQKLKPFPETLEEKS